MNTKTQTNPLVAARNALQASFLTALQLASFSSAIRIQIAWTQDCPDKYWDDQEALRGLTVKLNLATLQVLQRKVPACLREMRAICGSEAQHKLIDEAKATADHAAEEETLGRKVTGLYKAYRLLVLCYGVKRCEILIDKAGHIEEIHDNVEDAWQEMMDLAVTAHGISNIEYRIDVAVRTFANVETMLNAHAARIGKENARERHIANHKKAPFHLPQDDREKTFKRTLALRNANA